MRPLVLLTLVSCTSVVDPPVDTDGTVRDSDSDPPPDTDDSDPSADDKDGHSDPHTDVVDSDSDDDTAAHTDVDSDPDTDPVDTDTDLPPDPLAGPRFASGTRLTVSVWDAAGAEAFAGLYDNQLGVACAVIEAEPGQLRCVPIDDGERVVRYLDSACTQPVYASLSTACVNTGHLWLSADSRALCGSTQATSVFALSTTTVPAAWWRTTGAGACVAASLDPGATVYTFSPLRDLPIPPADLVAFVTEDRLGPEGVGVRVLVGDDGTQVAVGLVGPDGPCTPELLVGGWRCVPDRRAVRTSVGWSGDPTCATAPVAVNPNNPVCGPPLVVVQDGGTSTPSVYGLGAPWVGDVYDGARSCALAAGGGEAWALGPAVPATTWTRLTLPTPSAGDVAGRWWTSPAGTPLLAPADAPFLRVASGEACAPARTVSGVAVCLPVDARPVSSVSSFFADAACTQRVSVIGGQGNARWLFGRVEGCAGDVDTVIGSLEEVGATHVGDLYLLSGPTCAYAAQTPAGTTWRHTVDVDPVVALPALVRRVAP